jgi:hypothetical protein
MKAGIILFIDSSIEFIIKMINMKKGFRFLLCFRNITSIGFLIVVLSCSNKEDSPAPAKTTVKTDPAIPASGTDKMCGDSICKLPFRIMSAFIPSGFYDTGDQSVALLIDSCGEVPAYTGEGLRIRYTYSGAWGWGAHFLKQDNWSGAFKVNPAATQISFYVRSDYSANVTFNAFADVQYGKVELYKLASPVVPVWEKITIPLLGRPLTFNAPLNIVIDGVTQNGKVTIVDIKDVLIE